MTQLIEAQSQTDQMINAALHRREACYAEIERRRQNHRTQALEALPKPSVEADGEGLPKEEDRDASASVTTTIDAAAAPSTAPDQAAGNDADR